MFIVRIFSETCRGPVARLLLCRPQSLRSGRVVLVLAVAVLAAVVLAVAVLPALVLAVVVLAAVALPDVDDDTRACGRRAILLMFLLVSLDDHHDVPCLAIIMFMKFP